MNSILNDDWFKSILPKTKEQFNRRFDDIFQNIEELNLPFYTFCETGCIRSLTQFDWQGNFTLLANRFMELHTGIVYTVNNDPDAVSLCKNLSHVIATCDDSILYLSKFENINSINLFYLDSLDIEFNNPLPSINHHYNEFCKIINRRTCGNFFICIDDNVTDTVQKGYRINNLLKNTNILPIIEGYQSLYWISDINLELIKTKI